MKATILYSEHVETISMNAKQTCIHNVTLAQAKRKASSEQTNPNSVMMLWSLTGEVISSKMNGKWKDTSLAHCYGQ